MNRRLPLWRLGGKVVVPELYIDAEGSKMAVATYVTKTDLDANLEVVHGYVDTAVDTLTAEMDRQFKDVNGKLDKILTHLGIPQEG